MASNPSATKPEVLKPQRIFRDKTEAYRRKRRAGYRQMAKDCLQYLADGHRKPEARFTPFGKREISRKFFGMNLAPSPDPAGDSIQIAALRDLGVGAARMDISASENPDLSLRLLDALLSSSFAVTLHAVQDPEDASRMDDAQRQKAWEMFLRGILEKYGSRLEALEVGSTPNRHSWSGYTAQDYAYAAAVARNTLDAWAAAQGTGAHRPLLLGPNISDFAPYFTIGQLAECARHGARLDVMTDNLFIDRAGEPERFDPHVAGRALSGVARMDLLRKQKILHAIAARFDMPRCWCTYTHYTLNFGRVRARYVSESQYANYMVRSHILSAAAGFFERYYWGTLVSHYKGLIDEGVRVRPYPPYVHHRFATLGESPQWRRRDDFFRAYSTMTKVLAGARFLRRLPTPRGAWLLEFEGLAGRFLAGWNRDGRSCLADGEFISRRGAPHAILSVYGRKLGEGSGPIRLAEAPVYVLSLDGLKAAGFGANQTGS